MFEILEGDVTKTSTSHSVFVRHQAIKNTAARNGVHCGVVCVERKLLALHLDLHKNLNFVLKYALVPMEYSSTHTTQTQNTSDPI